MPALGLKYLRRQTVLTQPDDLKKNQKFVDKYLVGFPISVLITFVVNELLEQLKHSSYKDSEVSIDSSDEKIVITIEKDLATKKTVKELIKSKSRGKKK